MDKQPSDLEQAFQYHLRIQGFPEPVREYRFMAGRKFQADFAWQDQMIMVELEGGVYSGGRHVRGKGYELDVIKYDYAALQGWTLLRFTRGMVDDLSAFKMLRLAFAKRGVIINEL